MMGDFRSGDVLRAVQRLRPIADGLGISMAQLALAWVLREPNVASAIVGASRSEQVRDNGGASSIAGTFVNGQFVVTDGPTTTGCVPH